MLGFAVSLGFGACTESKKSSAPAEGAGGNGGSAGTGVAGAGGDGEAAEPVTKPVVEGFAQKGPLLNGANLVLSELDEFSSPTGRTFLTTIVDDSGAFRFRNVELAGPVAGIRVDGFFFNEVRGERSESQIALSAITDLSDRAAVNINLASHLEQARVQYLIDEGQRFSDAKQQALTDVFTAFSLLSDESECEPLELSASEELDITSPDPASAALLGISAILLGHRSDAEFSDTLGSIAGDLREDGALDSESTLESLVTHARAIDPAAVRTNLMERYETLGREIDPGDFECYLAQFIQVHTAMPVIPLVDYAEGTLLDLLFHGEDGMSIEGPEAQLEVNDPSLDFSVVFRVLTSGQWSYSIGANWSVTEFDGNTCSQHFTPNDSGAAAQNILIRDGGYRIDVFEGRQDVPAWSREFSVTDAPATQTCSPTPDP